MSSPTGASALLALLTLPDELCPWCKGRGALDTDGESYGCARCHGTGEVSPVGNARRACRNAIRRLIKARGGRVGPAAAALGVHPANLRAAAKVLGLDLPSVRGAPLGNQNARRP